MKNIESIKKKYLKLFANKHYNKSFNDLDDKEYYSCSYLAEVWAYIHSIVPEEHGKYRIFDFDGNKIDEETNEKQNLLSSTVALKVKNEICKYCWNTEWEEINKFNHDDEYNISNFLRKKSVMMDRRRQGNNIVIFGTSSKPIGRTMIASIIMKEAIKLRLTHKMRSHTYDWIDFSMLVSEIKKDSFDLADFRSCDWLVVDNIIKKDRSSKQNTFISDYVDPFFLFRFNNKLPTILVFKFDIMDETYSLENTFGVGINKIVNSKRTFKISLSG